MEGVCRAPGVQGGLAMLSRLQEGPLSRVLLTGIPAQGGFNAVYLGDALSQAQLDDSHASSTAKLAEQASIGLVFCLHIGHVPRGFSGKLATVLDEAGKC